METRYFKRINTYYKIGEQNISISAADNGVCFLNPCHFDLKYINRNNAKFPFTEITREEFEQAKEKLNNFVKTL